MEASVVSQIGCSNDVHEGGDKNDDGVMIAVEIGGEHPPSSSEGLGFLKPSLL